MVFYIIKACCGSEQEVKESILHLMVNSEDFRENIRIGTDHIELLSCNICNIDVFKSGNNWREYFKVSSDKEGNVAVWALKYSSFTIERNPEE